MIVLLGGLKTAAPFLGASFSVNLAFVGAKTQAPIALCSQITIFLSEGKIVGKIADGFAQINGIDHKYRNTVATLRIERQLATIEPPNDKVDLLPGMTRSIVASL